LEDFRLDHVAALYLAGRADEATKAFERLHTQRRCVRYGIAWAVSAVARAVESRSVYRDRLDVSRKWRLIESSLNRRDEDPYLLIEGNPTVDFRSALWMETTRRRLTGDNYESVRRRLAESWFGKACRLSRLTGSPWCPVSWTAVFAKRPPVTNSESALRLRMERGASLEPVERGRPAATPPTLPRGFRQLSVPEKLRTTRNGKEISSSWPNGMAQLPNSFSPVRVERGAPFTVAVSLSQNLDPVGEVSNGGYWIHLSRDGGASWGEPLYTGLLEYFPYFVLQHPRCRSGPVIESRWKSQSRNSIRQASRIHRYFFAVAARNGSLS